MSGIETPVFAFLGVVVTALVSTLGREWYSNWKDAKKAASPVGLAEAHAVAEAVALDREQWLDQQTRGLFDNVHIQLNRTTAELREANEQLDVFRERLTHALMTVAELERTVLRTNEDLMRCHLERREALDLVDAIRTAGGLGG